jgi:hypothetical protein
MAAAHRVACLKDARHQHLWSGCWTSSLSLSGGYVSKVFDSVISCSSLLAAAGVACLMLQALDRAACTPAGSAGCGTGRQLTTVLNHELLVSVGSFLAGQDMLALALTCKLFTARQRVAAAPGSGEQTRSIVEGAALLALSREPAHVRAWVTERLAPAVASGERAASSVAVAQLRLARSPLRWGYVGAARARADGRMVQLDGLGTGTLSWGADDDEPLQSACPAISAGAAWMWRRCGDRADDGEMMVPATVW